MPRRTPPSPGAAARCALLLIDVINDLEFDDGAALLRYARPMARKLAAFKQRARAAGVPVIYVNDNFGRWRSDFRALVRHCLHDRVCGAPIARLLQPQAADYFVLKPRHSGFYCTALEVLLGFLQTRVVILTGLAGDNCVLFTAHDAYMRGFRVVVPRDCVASVTQAGNRGALVHVARYLKADTRASDVIRFEELMEPTQVVNGASTLYEPTEGELSARP